MPADARLSAWMASWDILRNVNDLLAKSKRATPECWLLIAQAEAYRGLAQAPEDVGVAVGEWMQEQERATERTRKFVEGALNEYKAPKWKADE